MQSILCAVSSTLGSPGEIGEVEQVECIFNSFSNFSQATISLPSVLALVHLLTILVKRAREVLHRTVAFPFSDSARSLHRPCGVQKPLGHRLSELSKAFLQRSLPKKGEGVKETVAELVSVYLIYAENPIFAMERLILHHLPSVVEQRSYHCCTRNVHFVLIFALLAGANTMQ